MPTVVGTLCIKEENEETQKDTLIDQDMINKRKTNKNTVKYWSFRCQRVFAKLIMVNPLCFFE